MNARVTRAVNPGRWTRSVALLLPWLVIFSLVLSACGEAAPKSAPAMPASDFAIPAAAPAGQQASSSTSSSSGAGSSSSSTDTTTPRIVPLDRMVVRNAQMTLQVADVNVALGKVRGIAETYGGYVSTEHAYASKSGDQDQMVADVSIRVRADAYDQALDSVRTLAGKVVSVDESSEDVTQQYIDVDANLRNLQASESAILKLMDRTTNINDVLTLQRELTSVRGQIQRLDAQKQYLERQTSLSTISMHLQPPPVVESSPVGPYWNPLATVVRGWQNSLSVLRFIADAALVVVSTFWWAIAVVGAGVYVWRRHRLARGAAVTASPTVQS